jgi:hypothetical protein
MTDDEIEKWIETACNGDPLDFGECIDEESGPPLSRNEIKQACDRLAKWQAPATFQSDIAALCKRCESEEWFSRPDLKFLHDAFVLAEFLRHHRVDQIRLVPQSEQWPDGQIRIGRDKRNIEVTSEHGGRKLGDEYANVAGPTLVKTIAEPVERIVECLDSAIRNKINKCYGSRACLLVYLNMADFFGSQQVVNERAIRLVKQKHAGSFDDIFVLWKDKML